MTHPDLLAARNLIASLGLDMSATVPETQNAEYGAFVAEAGCGSVRFRVGKRTPAKPGLFVTVWQRAQDGSTEPFAVEDGVDLLVITVREESRAGQFVFPRSALVEHGIVSVAGRGGKRGFRLYPPWSATRNKQAQKSQRWQSAYFLDLENIDRQRARHLYEPILPPFVPSHNGDAR
ncbi:MepB family protein [Nocardia sp. NPDC056952]|uniref:MepB family protein n=1 Tax=Nocardia sp. NPDC056952 TaxID=3345979 RepID=UPI00364385DE